MDARNAIRGMEIEYNSHSLIQELEWFSNVLDTRIKLYFEKECSYASIYDVQPPNFSNQDEIYAQIIHHFRLSIEERLVLMLAFAPHICPQLLDIFFVKNATYDRVYTEFGGVKGQFHSGFLPTGETAIFLLTANDVSRRLQVANIFDPNHALRKYNILKLEKVRDNEPYLSGPLQLSQEYLSYFLRGKSFDPEYSSSFPAKRITTPLKWDDLVLEDYVRMDIEEINTWLIHQHTLMETWNLKRRLKPGYRVLFHGKSGTGKTLTACLLGKANNRPVYRIDLSQVVSKYIGETEKNLANIFDLAENKEWILFFDEADALFGKRSQTTDAKDRYANQEIAYLLQRVEDFNGLVILATNLRVNIDEAFSRRFQSMIHFPMPGTEQRRQLWKKAFSPPLCLAPDVDLDTIAEEVENISGGGIINVLRFCSLMAVNRQPHVVTHDDILLGIRKEFGKGGKSFEIILNI